MLKRTGFLLGIMAQLISIQLFGLDFQLQYSSSICLGDTGYLCLITPGNEAIDSIQFTGNNLIQTNDSSISYSPLSSGYYSFSIFSLGSVTSDSVFVEVLNPPVAAFVLADDSLCSGENILCTNFSASYSQAYWYLNDSLISTEQHLNFPAPDITQNLVNLQIKLVVENGSTCADSLVKELTILPHPVAIDFSTYPDSYFNNCQPGDTFHLQITNSSTSWASNSAYLIDWGNGSFDTLTAWNYGASIGSDYTESGLFQLQISILNSFACEALTVHPVFHGSSPSVSLLNPGYTTPLCAPQTFQFPLLTTDLSGEENTAGTIYTISFNDGTPNQIFSHPPPDTIVHTFISSSCGISSENYANAFSIKVLAENPCGSSISILEPIILNKQPEPGFIRDHPNPVCLEDTLIITNNSISGINVNFTNGTYQCDSGYVHNWQITPASGWNLIEGNLGDNPLNYNAYPGFNSGSNQLKLAFTLPGEYIISLTIENSCNLPLLYTDTISVPANPLLDVSLSTISGCSPLLVAVSNLSQGENLQHLWTINPAAGHSYYSGDATSQSPSFLFAEPGDFALEYNLSNMCKSLDTTINIQVSGIPEITGNNLVQLCLGDTGSSQLNFDENNASIAQFLWQIVPAVGLNLINSDLNQPNLQFAGANAGVYSMTCIADNSCGSDTVSMQVDIQSPPVFNLMGDTSLCAGEPTVLTANFQQSPAGADFLWSDGSTGQALSFTPSESQLIHLSVITGLGCQFTDSLFLTVHPLPVVNAGVDLNRCILGPVETLNGSPAPGYWSGNGIISPNNGLFDPSIPGLGPQLLVYHYTSPATGCSNQDTMQVYVRPMPSASFQIDSVFCVNDAAASPVNTSQGANFYRWFLNESVFSQLTTPPLNFTDTGYQTISLIASTIYGCADSAANDVLVLGIPEAMFFMEPDSGCDPLEVGFLNVSSGHSYSTFWRFGNGTESILENPQDVIYTINGVQDAYFEIILTEKNQCGKDDYVDSVHVFSSPSIDFNLTNTSGCEPYLLNLQSTYVDTPLSIQWDFGDGQTANSMVPDHLYEQDGIYQLTAKIWGPPGCIDPLGEEHQVQVTIYDKPEISLLPESQLVCQNYHAIIAATGADLYLAYDQAGNPLSMNQQVLNFNPIDTSIVTITGITDEGCRDTASAWVGVEVMPSFDLGNDTCLNLGEQIILTTDYQDISTLWTTGDTSSQIVVTEPSEDQICATLRPLVCPSLTDCIFIDYCPIIDLPDAFSPNGDGLNDRLRVVQHQIRNVDFIIYSRWGKMLYHSHDMNEGWDGTYDGIPQDMDVYIYTIEAYTNSGQVIYKTGNVSLLR